MASIEGSTLKHTSESKGAPLLTPMQVAFEGKDIEDITAESPVIQTIENRFVTDPTDPSVEHLADEAKPAEEVGPKPLKIDLQKMDFHLGDDQLDEESLLPGHKATPEMRPALSQNVELSPMNNALLEPFLEKEEAKHAHSRDDIEFVIPERPNRPHHVEQHALNFHELVKERPEHPTAASKPTPLMRRMFQRAGAKESKLQTREERRAARRQAEHQPVHAAEIHEKMVEQPTLDPKVTKEKQPVQVEAQPTLEVISVEQRRRGSLDFLRKLRKKPEIVNDAKSLEYVNQLFDDETMLVQNQSPAEVPLTVLTEESKPEKVSRLERAKKWFGSVNNDIRTYGGLNYFANKWNRPGDWLMSREGGRQKARLSAVLGVAAVAVAGGKLLEGTTGINPFGFFSDLDLSFTQSSGHDVALPSVAPHFESPYITPDANSAVVDGSNQFDLPQVPEVPAAVPIEETMNNPAFTIEAGQTGYGLFDNLGLSHEAWNDHANDLLQFPDFYLEDGDVRLAHEGVLSEEARQYLLDLKQEANG